MEQAIVVAGDDESVSDGHSLSHGGSTHSGSNFVTKTDKQKKSDSAVFEGQQAQNKAVLGSRILFLFVLTAAAAALAVAVYTVLREEEQDDFKAKLENLGSEFILLSNQNARTVLGVLSGISTSATSLIKAQRESKVEIEYPMSYLTMPDAGHQLDLARESTGALVIAYLPLVQREDYDLWVKYSESHKGWIAEGNDMPYDDSDMVNITQDVWEWKQDGRRILEDEEEACGEDYFGDRRRRHLKEGSSEKYRAPINQSEWEYVTPIWTMSPVPPVDQTDAINFNLLTKGIYSKAFHFTQESRLPSFLDVCYQANWFNVANSKEILQTVVASPVFSDFSEGNNAEVVGHFVSVVPWVQFFINNLVGGSEQLMVVVSNTCNEVFSFLIDSRNATFLAEEDLHNPKFDDMAIQSPFADLYNPSELPNGEQPTDHCVYTMTVYPTEAFEEQYTTNQPLYYCLGVLAIFASTSIAFLLFDCLVTRRQGRLLTTAKKQNVIVSSLYPKQVRDKLMDEVEVEGDNSGGRGKLKNYLSEEQGDGGINAVDGKARPEAIADHFPDTTIMFADMVGFTSWSSKREPNQVFALLEAVYAEFDIIAKRLRVFKVEVVGDCYVAVCGLPDPRKRHATIMAKFALECLEAMARVTKELEAELGTGTGELTLRVGLHSGGVVAGVLRGEKGRFQLFGDTMNTAARMEHTGVPNRVQLSDVTADLLVKAGKASWLIPREEMVQAKGKGELKTFFLRTKEATSLSHTSFTESNSDRSYDTSVRATPPNSATKTSEGVEGSVAIWTAAVDKDDVVAENDHEETEVDLEDADIENM